MHNNTTINLFHVMRVSLLQCFCAKNNGKIQTPLASLGLVSLGAATDGVTPFFSEKKTDDFFYLFFSHRRLHSDDLFLAAVVSSQLPPSDLVCPVFFLNSATFFLFHSGVTPLEGVTRGGPTPLPNDATETYVKD